MKSNKLKWFAMSFVGQLVAVEAAALAALLVVSAAMAGYAYVVAMSHNGNMMLSPISGAEITFAYTAILGLAPALLFGAPGYVVLLRRNLTRWPYVLLLGAAPGLIALALTVANPTPSVDISLGLSATVCGAAVASLTHLMYRRLIQNK